MKFEMYWKIKVLVIKWYLGTFKQDITIYIWSCIYSDDEGSEDEDEGEEGDYEEEYDEEDNDEDYEDEEGEEEEEEDTESPSYFFGKNPIQQNAWNNFQFGVNKTTPAQTESVSGLSSMLANLNPCSPFSFGLQPTTEVIFIIFILFLNNFSFDRQRMQIN